jgi:Na+-driven multidrug efflux pump
MIMQSALLGTKDSVTPLIVTLLCGGFNVIGDWFLVCYKNFGIRGAAIATAVSELISMALLAKAVCKFNTIVLQYCYVLRSIVIHS